MSLPLPIIRGALPDHIVKWLRRDNLGFFTGLAVRPFVVGEAGQRIDPNWLLPASAPDCFGGVPCVDASANIVAGGICEVGYNYGGAPSGQDFGFGDPNNAELCDYELDTSMSEEDIRTHPSFGALKTKYGWNESEGKFNETASESGGNALTSEGETVSKAYGVESWLVVGVMFRISYAVSQVPPDALTGIGTIIADPPGLSTFNIPTANLGSRNWLKLGPNMSKRGNAARYTANYMLSGPNGWLEDIYGAGQLEGVSATDTAL